MFKDLRVSTKLGLGFGTVIVLLLIALRRFEGSTNRS